MSKHKKNGVLIKRDTLKKISKMSNRLNTPTNQEKLSELLKLLKIISH